MNITNMDISRINTYSGAAAQYFCAIIFDPALSFLVHTFEVYKDRSQPDKFLVCVENGNNFDIIDKKYIKCDVFNEIEAKYRKYCG